MSIRPRISPINANGFIRYRNPMIPTNSLPRPVILLMKSPLGSISAENPSKNVPTNADANPNNFSKTNFVFSMNVTNFSLFFSSPIHFSVSDIRPIAAIRRNRSPIGPRNLPKISPKRPLPFFFSFASGFSFFLPFSNLPTSCASSAAASASLRFRLRSFISSASSNF